MKVESFVNNNFAKLLNLELLCSDEKSQNIEVLMEVGQVIRKRH